MVCNTFLINTVVQAALLAYGTYLVKSPSVQMEAQVLLAFMLYQGNLRVPPPVPHRHYQMLHYHTSAVCSLQGLFLGGGGGLLGSSFCPQSVFPNMHFALLFWACRV